MKKICFLTAVVMDALKKAASILKYSSDQKMSEVFRFEFGTDEVVCFTIFNQNGISYAINPK